MRIKTGPANSTISKVVDKDVFEFYPKCDPVTVELMSDEIATVKFELRILNRRSASSFIAERVIEPLPRFEEGDLTVLFSDGSSIKVYRELVSLYSTYIKECTEDSEITTVETFPKQAFIEMLYHIYPTLRPIYRNMRDYAKAAVSYQATPLIYELSKHLVNYNTRSVSKNRYVSYFRRMILQAKLVGTAIEFCELGPAQVGRQSEYGKPFIEKPFTLPDFFSEKAAENPSNTAFVFRRTPFYVNRGILEAHGTNKFAVNSEGLLQALFTKELEKECARGELLPGEVVVSLLNSLYPLGPAVPPQYLRGCHSVLPRP
ncbi:hypothetical protein OSTOST_20457 [Ostertagia ostertagi]